MVQSEIAVAMIPEPGGPQGGLDRKIGKTMNRQLPIPAESDDCFLCVRRKLSPAVAGMLHGDTRPQGMICAVCVTMHSHGPKYVACTTAHRNTSHVRPRSVCCMHRLPFIRVGRPFVSQLFFCSRKDGIMV